MKTFLGLFLSLLLLFATPTYAQDFDFALKVGMGKVGNITGVTKFGNAPSGIQSSATDIWSRADATPTQQIWLAPTAAAYHLIKSGDASDDTVNSADGARTIIIYGLVDWDTKESSEIIMMNGITDVTTDSMYVIIHRMKVLTFGTAGPNAGLITATAIAPSATTITAVIIAGEGQTNMAIYGVPSNQDFYLTRVMGDLDKATGGVASVNFQVLVNPRPDLVTTVFIIKDHIGVQSTGNNLGQIPYKYYPKFEGPCIIKIQGIASAADVDGHAGFDGYLVTTN